MEFEVLKKTIIERLGIEPSLITPDAKIEKDLELDSTDTVVIALEVKKLYQVDLKFPDTDMTLSEICQEVAKLRA